MTTSITNLRRSLFYRWLPIGFALSVAMLFGYALAQQTLRMSADDPQVQLATDTARAMATGQPSSTEASSTTVDLTTSLAPFTIIYDSNLKPIAGTGKLGGQFATPPPGVFDYARAHGRRTFTWAPAAGVRLATVLVPVGTDAQGGYVLAGRSLSEVERRTDEIGLLTLLAWILAMVASFGVTVTVYTRTEKAAS